tara:strand:+ start:1456 stop:1755 length:300 start_codon:yes stop_codon:yes gene_type:complete
MPYIKKEKRDYFYYDILDLNNEITSSGELNYCITKLILNYLPSTPKYDDYNTVIGVLECVKQELYRRLITDYEDKKCSENGDVFNTQKGGRSGCRCSNT